MTAENFNVDLAPSIALLAAFCSGAVFMLAASLARRREPAAEPQPYSPPVIGAPPDWQA